jgi:hypothetical protein
MLPLGPLLIAENDARKLPELASRFLRMARCGEPVPAAWAMRQVFEIAEEAFTFLDAPVRRLGGADLPIPYSIGLEWAAIPESEAIVDTVRGLFAAMRLA